MPQFNRASVWYDNKILDATLSATTQALSVDYVKSMQLGDVWRSTSTVNQTIIAAWSDEQRITGVWIGGHNYETGATVRIRISDNADLSSPAYDATFYIWPSVIGWDEGGWDLFGWDGVIPLEDLTADSYHGFFVLNLVLFGTLTSATSTTAVLPTTVTRDDDSEEDAPDNENAIINGTLRITGGTGSGQSRTIASYAPSTRTITLDEAWSTTPDNTSTFALDLSGAETVTADDYTYSGKYLGITLNDGGGTASYNEIGWLYAGDYLQPEFDIDPPQVTHNDASERIISDADYPFISSRRQTRVVQSQWPFLSEEEARRGIRLLRAKAGGKRPVGFLPFTERSERGQEAAVYGLLSASMATAQVRQDYTGYSYVADLIIEEI